MASVNKVILVGNLGADPEIRYTPGGKAVGEFRMATAYKWSGGEETEWHRVVVWEKLAEIASEYLHKGSQVYVEGRIKTRSWDKDDGTKGYVTEVVAERMQLLGPKAGKEDESPLELAERVRKDFEAEKAPKKTRGRPKKAAAPVVNDDDTAFEAGEDPFAE